MGRKHIPARETFYNGIKMRSRLEAQFAAALDELGVVWEYEPRAFASGKTQYLPDFRVLKDGGEFSVYIEVKPYLDEEVPTHDPAEIFKAMRVIYRSDPSCRIAIATPALAPYVLMEWSEPWSLEWLDRSEKLDVDKGRDVIIEQVGLAAWFRLGTDEPVLMPLGGLEGDYFLATAVSEGAGPLPFDFTWRK